MVEDEYMSCRLHVQIRRYIQASKTYAVHHIQKHIPFRNGSLCLDSQSRLHEPGLCKPRLDPVIRRHFLKVSKDARVNLFTLSGPANGLAGTERSNHEHDIGERHAIVDKESRWARSQVVLEELEGTSESFLVEVVLLLSPSRVGHRSETFPQIILVTHGHTSLPNAGRYFGTIPMYMILAGI